MRMRRLGIFLCLAVIAGGALWGAGAVEGVRWTALGKDHRDSMPIGNGDLGLNVWTEANGDVVMLIAKTDAWSENGELLKIGQVRLRLRPNPFVGAKGFRQTLDVQRGVLGIEDGAGARVEIWVDANRPVVHVEYGGGRPMEVTAAAELWRLAARKVGPRSEEFRTGLRELEENPSGADVVIDPDTVLKARGGRVEWCHHNARSIYPEVLENQHLGALVSKYPDPLLGRTFGAAMEGTGMAAADDLEIRTVRPMKAGRVDLYVMTERAATPQAWGEDMDRRIAREERVSLVEARKQHEAWWGAFWNRSWIRVSGDANAEAVTRGYAMQRWMMGASGRGAMPAKFNGGLFSIGDYNTDGKPPAGPYDPAKGELTPDFRRWGAEYWFQNNRLLYWPAVEAGDEDLLQSFFGMYRRALPLAEDRNRLYYKHGGAAFAETIYFWGTPSNVDFGWGNPDVTMVNPFIRYHFNGNLELTAMMLDVWDDTRDEAFARQTLLPVAWAVTTYFDEHWKKVAGKLHFDPSQSLETDRPAVNPAPDIAGLMFVLPRLLALPETLTMAEQRSRWKQMLVDLPPLPRGTTNAEGKQPEPETEADPAGKPILWTAAHWTPTRNGRPGNVENPELYAVFPYQLFGVGLPDLELARNTFSARRFPAMTCWTQGGMDAAVLGLAEEARRHVVANFTAYGVERFPWFWRQGHDSEPDLDNGGAGSVALELMVLQERGDKLLLLPAWPKEWDVEFKLHAPRNTTVEGRYASGRLERLVVTPESRRKDIVLMDGE
jgi:alpha-L-fucosidase 2